MIFSRKTTLGILAALALAGCGSSGTDAPGVASAGGSPSAVASADPITAYVEGQRAWVKCLRAEGVQVSDPDPKGNVSFTGNPKKDPKFLAASQKCQPLQQPRPAELNDKVSPEDLEIARRYAECMRANGVPEFPDPGPDGIQPERPDGTPLWDQNSAAAVRAGKICDAAGGFTPGPVNG
ncbi:hypothetical protein [Catellatospora sp. NPDC049133]|uniref:hypothetical protein n=1 Tax=Catellatospora sp. NPDC049133 TaxID=3155499 RepID=UPI0033CB618D